MKSLTFAAHLYVCLSLIQATTLQASPNLSGDHAGKAATKVQGKNEPQSSPSADGKIIDLEVKVLDKIVSGKTKGLRTLFIIVYDAQSAMPMPYGALKVDLMKDPEGTVYKGTLDSKNINVMSGGPVPSSLRLKARLDKDGSAGKDAPGDFTGTVEGIKTGGSVTITIDKEIT